MGGHYVRLFHEHQRLAKTLAGTHDLDDLLVAVWRDKKEFHLTVHDDVEAAGRVAFLEQDVAALDAELARAHGNAIDLFRSQLAEQRQVAQERLALERSGKHGNRSPRRRELLLSPRDYRPFAAA
jgi:hypothetical protein